MGDPAGGEDGIARVQVERLIADLEQELAGGRKEPLVLFVMQMPAGAAFGHIPMLEQEQGAGGVCRRHFDIVRRDPQQLQMCVRPIAPGADDDGARLPGRELRRGERGERGDGGGEERATIQHAASLGVQRHARPWTAAVQHLKFC